MLFQHIGHAEFLITLESGLRIVTDPYDASCGYPIHRAEADAVLVSHHHHDHDAVENVDGYPQVIDYAGEHTLAPGVRVTGILGDHDDAGGSKRGKTLLFLLEAEDLRVAHLGDIGAPLTDEQRIVLQEIDVLMGLLGKAIAEEVDKLHANGVRLLTTGRMENLPVDCQTALQKAMEKTAGNTRLSLVLALSYSGRSEIVDVAKSIAREAAAGNLNPDNIDETTIQQHLYHPEIPDVDLMIRTGGDMRVSNFLLWEIAYAELFFTPVLWPDFRKENLREIVTQFSSRERRFGKTGEQVRAH